MHNTQFKIFYIENKTVGKEFLRNKKYSKQIQIHKFEKKFMLYTGIAHILKGLIHETTMR